MKKQVLLGYFLMQMSIIGAAELPEISQGAFTFIRNAATGVQIDLDEVDTTVIQEVGSLIDPAFNINHYNKARDPITKVRFLFRFRNNPVRTFKYNGEQYTLQSERIANPTKAVTCVTRYTLYDAHNQLIKPQRLHHATAAIEPAAVTPKENGLEQPAPDLKTKCALRPHFCTSFGKALCAATITGVVVYYAFGLYNKNARNKQQPFSQKKWALGCATVVGLGTFVYVHFNTN